MSGKGKEIAVTVIAILLVITAIVLMGELNTPNGIITAYKNNKIVEDSNGDIYEPMVLRSTGNNIKEEEQESSLLDSYNIYKGLNEDTIAYLRIRETTMDFPIVQQHSKCSTHHVVDNCYYLYRDILKRRAVNPTAVVFADCGNVISKTASKLDGNTVIYGHNWDNNEDKGKKLRLSDPKDVQFAQLLGYTNLEWLQDHPILELNTGGETSYWSPAYVFYTDSLGPTAEDGFNYFKRVFTSEDIDVMKSRSVIYDENGLDTTKDKSLTLSTCSYKYGRRKDLRFVTVFKLLDADTYESALELASDINYTINDNPDTSWA